MLVSVQYPISDVRGFMPAETSGRLPLLDGFMTLEPGHDFVRSFGPVSRRRRGGVGAWPGEDVFAGAARGIRFPPSLGKPEDGVPWTAPHWRSAFRRLHTDGLAVARLEMGLVPTSREWCAQHRLKDFVNAALGIPVAIPTADPPEQLNLGAARAAIARLYERSTSTTGATTDPKSWWCQPGSIGVVIESELDLDVGRPAVAVPSLDRYGIVLYHWTEPYGRDEIDVWAILHDQAPIDVRRRLRIHLLRLHAEWEAMRRVLNNVARNRVPVDPHTPHTDALLRYLNERTNLLQRRRTLGLPASELFDASYGLDEMVHAGDLASLRAQLSATMPNVLRKVEDVAVTKDASEQLRILLLQANPTGTPTINLGAEQRAINEALRDSPLRNHHSLRTFEAVRVEDIQTYCLEVDPHIVHISAHGDPSGGVHFHGANKLPNPVPQQALAELFGRTGSNVRCVVLSACGSASAADAICARVDTAVGTTRGLKDSEAVGFSAGFYRGLGSRFSIDEAFKLGCNQANLERNDPDVVLRARSGVDPTRIVFDITP